MLDKVSIIVRALHDAEAGVWVATSNDIDGLAVEAQTLEQLEQKVSLAIADLLELNGGFPGLAEVPVHIMAESLMRVANPGA